MRKLILCVVVALILVTGDVLARVWAQNKLAEQAAAYYPPSSTSTADISSFPFLGRLLLAGDVPRVTVRMEALRLGVFTVRHLEFDLHDVTIDRNELFSGRARVLDVGAGRVEALVDTPPAGGTSAVAPALARFLPCDAEVSSVPEGVLVACAVDDVPSFMVPGAAAFPSRSPS